MRFSKRFMAACSFMMCLFMSNIPALALANQAMISTNVVIAELDRAQTEQKINDYLNRTDVRNALLERGVSADEVSSRLASLSETELRSLSTQVEQARAGGDILITILVVVLIIFLIKRI